MDNEYDSESIDTEVGQERNMKATGNKKIILKDWERKLLDIIDNDDKNATLHKIPGAATID
nr:unnamed protein product [Callosobruchus analis]